MSAINWNVPPPTYDDHSRTTTLTPYLQLPHLLSLTWLAYPILSLLFVAFRLQLSLASAQSEIATAKVDLLSSCNAAEQAATAAASMPRYMALATNKQFADAVNGSMNAARAALILALTVMEAIINFIIDIYRSTFLCVIELVIRGGLSVVISAVQELNTVIQGLASSLRTGIQNDISGANSVITSAINAINKVNPFGTIKAPQIPVPSLDSLQNVTLPSSFQQTLTNLNASIPSVADIKSTVESFVDTPFELLKQDINNTFTGLSFDPTLLPIPAQNRLSFCNQLNTSIVDDIGRDLVKAAKIGVLVLILLALLLVGFNCLLTWYKWRCMNQHLENTRQAWMSDPTLVHTSSLSSSPQITLSNHNLMMLHANSEHPLVTKIMNLLATRTRMTPSHHINTRWFLHYVFHPPALACFLIGFGGLLSVEIQLLALGPLVSTSRGLAASAVSDFSSTISNSINESMYNQSSLYANEINNKVDAIQTTINNGVFGWVNGTTTTLNTTINNFYDDVKKLVDTVFNGTILEAPANDFLQCFLGNKVNAIDEALTFLHNNLNIDIPRVNQDILVLSPQSVNEATAPIAAAVIGGGPNDNQGVVGRLVNTYEMALRKERWMFAIFMGLWGIVVLMAISVILWHSYGKPYMYKRGRRKWEREQRSGLMSISQIASQDTKHPGDEKREFHSFTPLPSPKGSAFKPFWASRSNSPTGGSPSLSVESVVQKDSSMTLPQPTTSSPAPQKRVAKLLAIGRKAMGREQLKNDEEDDEAAPPVVIDPSMEEHHGGTPWYTKIVGLVIRKENQQQTAVQENTWDASAMTRKEREHPKLQIYTETGSLADHDPPPSHRQQEDEYLTRSRWSSSPDATQTSWMRIMSPTKKLSALPTVISPPAMIVSTLDSPPHKSIAPVRPKVRQNADIPLDVGPVYEDPPSSENPTPTVAMKPILPMPLYSGFDRSQMQTQPLSVKRNVPPPPRHPRRNQESPPPPLKFPRIYEPQNFLAPPPDHHKRSPSIRPASQQWRITNGAPGDLSSDSSASSVDMDMTDPCITPVTRLLTTMHARHSSSVVNPFITPFDDEHKVTIENGPADMRKSMQTNPFTAVAL